MPINGIKQLMKFGVQSVASAATLHWRPHSRLLLVRDRPDWSIGHDMRELSQMACRLGILVGQSALATWTTNQCVYVGSHFDLLLNDRWFGLGHRLATSYFHGRPGQGVSAFDRCFETLRKRHSEIQRVQVSCSGMETLVLESGITPDAVFRIPIGINLDLFAPPMEAQRHAVRAELGLPESATVIGSFQKDGVGWEDGLEPKLIKGPDVLLQTIERLNSEVKNLTVLLSGPARGYVKQGLSRLGIPFKHIFFKDYISLCRIYQALDLYLVTSREEGGPKSVLESMASGVPLVSTRVGQAVDLIQHGVNGWLADVEDVEGLTYWALRALSTASDLPAIRTAARRTAEANSYMVQLPLWREFFRGFVE